jgi:hypothetical protein
MTTEPGQMSGEENFVPRVDDFDMEDVPEEALRAELARRHKNKQAALRRDAVQVHGVEHVHDTADDQEGGVDAVEREADAIEWQDPSNLEAPPPRPGFVQRWIRSAFRTGEDPASLQRAHREGWRPRALSTVPSGYAPATMTHKQLGDVIAVEGLILMELPARVAKARKKFYDRLMAAQNEAIERDIHKDERPGKPIIAERRTTVTRGRRPDAGD